MGDADPCREDEQRVLAQSESSEGHHLNAAQLYESAGDFDAAARELAEFYVWARHNDAGAMQRSDAERLAERLRIEFARRNS